MTHIAEREAERLLPRLRLFRGDDEASMVDDCDFDPDPDNDPGPGARCLNIDDYWAGRNRAARRSARSAA